MPWRTPGTDGLLLSAQCPPRSTLRSCDGGHARDYTTALSDRSPEPAQGLTSSPTHVYPSHRGTCTWLRQEGEDEGQLVLLAQMSQT